MLDQLKNLINPPISSKIFFFHIAKCGGTSIANSIVQAYKPWRSINSGTVVTLNEQAAMFAESNSLTSERNFRRNLLNYLIYQNQVRCISGHYHYSNIAHELYGGDWHFVTVLRNPAERFLSHFNHIQKNKSIDQRQKIEDFLDTPLAVTFGRAFVDEVTQDLDKTNLGIDDIAAEALERYRRFSLVGSIDDTNGFANAFFDKFNHKLQIKHLNKTPEFGARARSNLSREVLNRISDLCEPDDYIYRSLLSVGK